MIALSRIICRQVRQEAEKWARRLLDNRKVRDLDQTEDSGGRTLQVD